MNVLDLFSGIGGFSLGLERAGMRTVAFCEVDPFCRQVLAKHWPSVPIYDDVRSLTAERLRADGITADVICGGFPCQDISVAGKGEGLEGERSGLWSEYARIISEVRPRYVIVENVAALLGRGLDQVLGDLAAIGFDAEWHCIPASAIGAPHERNRVWLIAHSDKVGRELSDELARRLQTQGRPFTWESFRTTDNDIWVPEYAELCRELDGVSNAMDRIGALGNAVVPQIPEIIGRAIMSTLTAHRGTEP